MKNSFFIFFLIFSLTAHAQNTAIPKLFNTQLNSFLNVRDFCISSTENEAFFTIQSPDQQISQLAFITKQGKTWEAPLLLSFCDSFMYLEPFLAPDGNRLFFVSDRPLTHNGLRKDFDIWYVDRISEKQPWSEPKNLGTPVNSKYDEFYPTVSRNNNLYFTMNAPDGLGKDDIYITKWNGTEYLAPTILDSNINSSGYEFNAFISEDEDYILYTKYKAKDGFGSGDLYISRKKDGAWQMAKNLGLNINSKAMDYCPFYNARTNTLYFTSRRNALKTKLFTSVNDFQSYITNGSNGLSKIYQVNIPLNKK